MFGSLHCKCCAIAVNSHHLLIQGGSTSSPAQIRQPQRRGWGIVDFKKPTSKSRVPLGVRDLSSFVGSFFFSSPSGEGLGLLRRVFSRLLLSDVKLHLMSVIIRQQFGWKIAITLYRNVIFHACYFVLDGQHEVSCGFFCLFAPYQTNNES